MPAPCACSRLPAVSVHMVPGVTVAVAACAGDAPASSADAARTEAARAATRRRCGAGMMPPMGFPVYGLVQVTAGAEGEPLPRKPKVVEADAGSAPLYETLLTETDEPLVVTVPFHTCAMLCPGLNVHFAVQPSMALPPAVTVTS